MPKIHGVEELHQNEILSVPVVRIRELLQCALSVSPNILMMATDSISRLLCLGILNYHLSYVVEDMEADTVRSKPW